MFQLNYHYAYTFHGFDQVPGAAIAQRAQPEQIAIIRAALGAEPLKHQQTDAPTFSHTMIHVTDVAQPGAWYRAVFDLKTKFVTEDGQYIEMLAGTTTLAFNANTLERSKYGNFAENSLENLPSGMLRSRHHTSYQHIGYMLSAYPHNMWYMVQ